MAAFWSSFQTGSICFCSGVIWQIVSSMRLPNLIGLSTVSCFGTPKIKRLVHKQGRQSRMSNTI